MYVYNTSIRVPAPPPSADWKHWFLVCISPGGGEGDAGSEKLQGIAEAILFHLLNFNTVNTAPSFMDFLQQGLVHYTFCDPTLLT